MTQWKTRETRIDGSCGFLTVGGKYCTVLRAPSVLTTSWQLHVRPVPHNIAWTHDLGAGKLLKM